MCELSVASLNKKLEELVNWTAFALYLPGIRQSHVDIIKSDNPLDVLGQKQALFGKWLKVRPSPSWDEVILALQKAGECKLAADLCNDLPIEVLSTSAHEEVIDEAIVVELSRLHQSFSSMVFEANGAFEEKVKSGEMRLSRMVQRAQIEKAYDLDGKLKDVNTVDEFFTVLSQYYHFLDIHLLLTLVQAFFNSSDLLQKLKAHDEDIKQFKNSNEVRRLYMALQPFVTKLPQDVPITIRVHNCWGRHNMWLVETLIQTAFPVHSSMLKWYRVMPGSVTIVLLTMQHTANFMSQILLNYQKASFLKLVGIISLQIGHTYVIDQDSTDSDYTFEKGILQAAEMGNYEAVEFLLELVNVDPDTQADLALDQYREYVWTDNNNNNCFKTVLGMTSLMVATCNSDSRMVQLLLQNGANPELKNKVGHSAIMYAAIFASSNHDIIFNLLSKSITSSAVLLSKSITSSADMTPIHYCSENGLISIVERLLDNGVDPNTQTTNGITPLYLASENRNTHIVKQLLMVNADPNIQTKIDGATPLYVACMMGNDMIVEQLLTAKADPNIPTFNGISPLHAASRWGQYSIVDILITANSYLNAQTDKGETSVFMASRWGHAMIVKKLAQSNADLNIATNDGQTPLYIACWWGHTTVVKQLLMANADMNISANDRTTPLYIACQRGNTLVVKQLLMTNANMNIPANDGTTPLDIASSKGHFDIVELLLNHKGADY